MKDDKPSISNADLMPRELSEIRKPEKIRDFGYHSPQGEPEPGRFSVINVHATIGQKKISLKDDKPAVETKTGPSRMGIPASAKQSKTTGKPPFHSSLSQAKKASPSSSKITRTKDAASTTKKATVDASNYRAKYFQKKRELENLAVGKRKSPQELQREAAERKRLEDAEVFLRTRARELIALIQKWRGEFGMGGYEADHIRGMIAMYEQELNAIDPRYWP